MSDNPISIPAFPPNLAANQITLQDINSIVDEKLREAVYVWALVKMGDQRDALLDRARRNFYLLFGLAWKSEPADRQSLSRLIELVRETPLAVPQTPSVKNPVPDAKLAELQQLYKKVLGDIKKWRRRKGQSRTRKMELMNILPGISHEVVGNWRSEMRKKKLRASDVAYEYLATLNDIPSGAALKKQLAVVTSVPNIQRRIVERIAREAGLKILSSPSKKQKE